MRPVRLELQGFASFRDHTELDLDGVDLFVLSGPTGAGKSSIIDALVFALYGSVPRLDDRRLVAPVITQGQLEARVRLTFDVDAARYAATRVVRRTKTGATTKEARLERLTGTHAEVIAGTADELSTAVTQLLGLTFEHFTRTVVLPQGAFQEFLHATPKDRQDLLVQLLDLDIYRRVAQASRERATAAEATVVALDRRLREDLAGATDEAVAAAQARVDTLTTLESHVDAAADELRALEEQGREARRAAQDADARLALVAGLQVPETVPVLASRLRAAHGAVARAAAVRDAAAAAAQAADDTVARYPDPGQLHRLREIVQDRDEARAALPKAQAAAAAAAETLRRVTAAAAVADTAVQAADAALHALERRHLAHAVAADLEAGRPCPVCERTVEVVPDRAAPADLDAARRAAERARADHRAAQDLARRAATAADRADAAAAHAADQARTLSEQAAAQAAALDLPDAVPAIDERLAATEAARRARATARADEDRAARALAEAQQAVAQLRDREEAAWRAFSDARDTVAPLGPPPVARGAELGSAWEALVAWARAQEPELRRDAQQAAAAIATATATYRERLDRLRADVDGAGLEVAGAGAAELGKAVVTAVAAARHQHQRLLHDLRTADATTEQRDAAHHRAQVARELGQQLNARNFENWLLTRALRRLVVGASRILRELTQDTYSLAVADDGSFQVVDHRNADELRSARTLSGGETFLASLALALALAEHVAELAAHGSARLEALFLDEGFGTLDADTLDTVAVAIEELGSRGRMVGLITHVRDLAERVPVRFEVRRAATGSTVEKVVV